MTMQSKASKAVFNGNGATTDFPFDFKVWDTSEISVTITGPDGASIPATGWTATLTDTGGTVTYRKDGAPLPSGWKLAILRNMPFTQPVDLLSGTRFDPEVIETALDKATAERQQLLEQLRRAVILPPTSDETPEDMAQELLRARDDVQDMLAEVGTEIGNHTIITAEGSTAGRTLASRFADVVNVKDFGAKGDGVTDDTAAFEAAAASGKSVFVPAASYYLGATVKGSFFAVSEVVLTGTHCTIERIDEGGVKAKLALLAQKLSHVDTSLDITDFPNRSTHAVQSLCYDSTRKRFYVGMKSDDVNNAKIVTMSSIDEYLLGSSYTVPAGHINDMTYDAQNDRVIIAPGTELANQLLVMNPVSYTVSAVTVASSAVWEVSIDNRTGWIYFATGGKLRRCNEDFVVDKDFSITFPSATSLPSKSAVSQGSFFVDGCFVLIRNMRMDDHWARNEFVIVDITTGISTISSFTVPSWEEVETADIANGVLEVLANTDTRKGVVSHKISMDALVDKPFVRFLSYTDLDSIRYPGEYRIGSAEAFGHIANTPPYATGSGALVLVYTAGTDYIVQEYRGGNQEWFYRTCNQEGVWSSWRKTTGFYGRWVYNGFDANECTSAGTYVTTSGLTNIPEGTNGVIINFETQQRTNLAKIVKQFFIRQGTTGVSEHAIYLRQLQYNESSESWTYGDWVKIITERDTFPNNFAPKTDNTYTLGTYALRWSQLYAATASINTSDAREKTSVTDPNEALMRAWAKVNFNAFQFTDAVEKKGEDARIHFGVIAQQVAEAFASEGLDASRYALFCYDKWDDEYEDVEVVDVEAVLDEDGNEITPAVTHTERRLVTPAGDRYGIRYSEALALECAYQRWRLDKLEAKMNAADYMTRTLADWATGQTEPDGSREHPFAFLYGMDVKNGSYYSYEGKLWLAKADMPACVWTPGTEGLWQWELVE